MAMFEAQHSCLRQTLIFCGNLANNFCRWLYQLSSWLAVKFWTLAGYVCATSMCNFWIFFRVWRRSALTPSPRPWITAQCPNTHTFAWLTACVISIVSGVSALACSQNAASAPPHSPGLCFTTIFLCQGTGCRTQDTGHGCNCPRLRRRPLDVINFALALPRASAKAGQTKSLTSAQI